MLYNPNGKIEREKMKYLVRYQIIDGKKVFVDMQSVTIAYVNEYINVEELPEKEGFYTTYEYDKEKDKIVGKYIEIPKTPSYITQEEKKELIEKIDAKSEETDTAASYLFELDSRLAKLELMLKANR